MNDIPTIGHNISPSEEIAERANDLVAAANKWMNTAKAITNEEMAGRCSDFLAQVQAEMNAAEKARKAEKAPHVEAGKAVDATYSPIKTKLETVKKLLGPLLTVWLQKKELERQEAERQATEEAERKSLEAELAAREAEQMEGDVVQAHIAKEEAEQAAQDAAKEADRIANSRAQVKGDLGPRAASLRTTYRAEIVDYPWCLWHFKDHPDVKAAVEKAANQHARSKDAKDIYAGKTASDRRLILHIVSEQKAV